MVPLNRPQLTSAEQQAVALIRDLRRQVAAGDLPDHLGQPAYLARHVIMLYHGHVQIRMSRIAPEVGMTMRTLERSFQKTFHVGMRELGVRERLSFAQALILKRPDLKMSVVAKHLGYDDPNVFERFFRQHAGMSPRAWSIVHHAQIS